MIGKGGYVYIVSYKNRTVYYIGITSNLYARAFQHKNGEGSAFTKRYVCTDLIYYQFFDHIESAIEREKQMKKWKRKWKEREIKEFNPDMNDLFDTIEDMQ